MFSEELESVIEAALADGVLTAKEREVLHKRAAAEGVDPDELDVVIDGRLAKMKREEDWLRPAPPSDKFGDVKKCPRCGEPVEPMAVKCSACGYEFRNVDALNSSQKLAEKLEAIDEAYRGKNITSSGWDTSWQKSRMDNAREKVTVIKSFPVPTTKEDLLDFAVSMQSRWKSSSEQDEQSGLRSAYKAKYEECVNKSKLLFPDDPMFQGVFEQHKNDKKIKWSNMSSQGKAGAILGIGCLGMILLCLLLSALGFD